MKRFSISFPLRHSLQSLIHFFSLLLLSLVNLQFLHFLILLFMQQPTRCHTRSFYLLNCYWPSPAQWLFPSLTRLTAIWQFLKPSEHITLVANSIRNSVFHSFFYSFTSYHIYSFNKLFNHDLCSLSLSQSHFPCCFLPLRHPLLNP
jgi:hypothetical protein